MAYNKRERAGFPQTRGLRFPKRAETRKPSGNRANVALYHLMPALSSSRRAANDAAPALALSENMLNPFLFHAARPTRPVSPQTRLAVAIEQMRMGPYRTLCVVETNTQNGVIFLGVLTEAVIVRAFVQASCADERARLRELPVSALMESYAPVASPEMRASESEPLFAQADAAGQDALPVVDSAGYLLGMVGRSDLVRELSRPFRPPQMGGMATPVGVYLSSGAASGGAGTLALVATGAALFSAHFAGLALSQPLQQAADLLPPASRPAFAPFAILLATLVQSALFFALVRLSPLAGFHAAEHQVVHAVERGEPLLREVVRTMPRVHPRCGTNLAAGGLLLGVGGAIAETALAPLHVPTTVGYLLSGVLAFVYWRPFGSWLQQYLTTRPATDHQIDSGIRAARELLNAHDQAPEGFVPPHTRLWRAGFVQILCGFALTYALIWLCSFIPALRGLRELLTGML